MKIIFDIYFTYLYQLRATSIDVSPTPLPALTIQGEAARAPAINGLTQLTGLIELLTMAVKICAVCLCYYNSAPAPASHSSQLFLVQHSLWTVAKLDQSNLCHRWYNNTTFMWKLK